MLCRLPATVSVEGIEACFIVCGWPIIMLGKKVSEW
jgi:hypothetical protein